MEIILKREINTAEETLGRMTVPGCAPIYTLEDEYRAVKVKGETRIPCGTYTIKFRTWGAHHIQYAKKFPRFHRGMLQLQSVPNFEGILIHIGNTDKDTAGCILVGSTFTRSASGKISIQGSTVAYEKIYPVIAAAISKGEKVTIKIID